MQAVGGGQRDEGKWQCCCCTGGRQQMTRGKQAVEMLLHVQQTMQGELTEAMSLPGWRIMQQERVADDGTKQQERAMEEAGRRQKKSYGGEQASGA